jgi:hypothetical protein
MRCALLSLPASLAQHPRSPVQRRGHKLLFLCAGCCARSPGTSLSLRPAARGGAPMLYMKKLELSVALWLTQAGKEVGRGQLDKVL